MANESGIDRKPNRKLSKAGIVLAAGMLAGTAGCAPAEKQTPNDISTPAPVTQVELPTSKPSIDIEITPAPSAKATFEATPKPTAEATVVPTPTENEHTTSNIVVSSEDAELNYKRLTQREPLSQENQSVKDKIVQALREKQNIPPSEPVEGVVYESENVKMTFQSGPDTFEGAILIRDFDKAKKEAEAFLIKQGFSKDAIYSGIGFFYYVNKALADSLPSNTPFNPNPYLTPEESK